MSEDSASNSETVGQRFDLIRRPWFLPSLVLCPLIALRIFLPSLAERPELAWLDLSQRARIHLGTAVPLDPSIRFLELSINDEIARRYATDGEYTTAESILKTLETLRVKVIALDIMYTHGLEKDQIELANTIQEINARGNTTVVVPFSIEKKRGHVPEQIKYSLPLAEGSTFAGGAVNAVADNHWREYRQVHVFEKKTYPSLAAAAFSASRPGPLKLKEAGIGRLEWKELTDEGEVRISFVDDSRIFLNLQHSYYEDSIDQQAKIGPRVWFISDLESLASDLSHQNNLINSPLTDTIVFFGYNAEVDGKPTAHGNMEPGMTLHGTALNDLIHGTSIYPSPLWLDICLFCVVSLIASLTFTSVRKKRTLVAIALIGLLILLALGWIAIWFFYLLIPAVASSILWGLAVVIEVGRRWTWEQRERTHRDALLGFYFSPAILKQVTKNLDMIRPKSNDVAVLLSDLRGFTTLCETQPVERVFELLNRLFGVETEIALRENGSLSRFAGDQFLAYWGAPEPVSDAPDRALRAAIEIQRTLIARREAAEEGDLDAWLRIGVGLHCGRGLVGHVGSRSYRDYNIVGDSINTTARVEGQTKNYAAPVLATGEFIEALAEPPPALHVDCVIVKGKANATDLYAILLYTEDHIMAACQDYEKAFNLYRQGQFKEALELFETFTDVSFETVAVSSRLLIERIKTLIESPPLKWDGVFELTSK